MLIEYIEEALKRAKYEMIYRNWIRIKLRSRDMSMPEEINRIVTERSAIERLNKYAFLTLHRPSNVDTKDKLAKILDVLSKLQMPIIFPIHPRTKKRLEEFGLKLPENIIPLQPLSFSESLFLWKDALCVLTDSGGLQEETTALSVPCLTLRDNTERPITVEIGTNTIIGDELEKLLELVKDIEEGRYKKGKIPEKWDGKAAERIVEVLRGFSTKNNV